ncbi:Dynein light chain LC6, flagellar outer arm [Senna tora]|uniref:Dynein light chain n=1 Tax=Senna tora TaxID=362788 RepID=A0A835CFE6_9FABA|nr:Dynein light chain LC6, flagellar outer arm [Senna tora]
MGEGRKWKSHIGKGVVEGRKSVSQIETLCSVSACLQVKVLVADMPNLMQVHAFRCARRTYDSLEQFSSKHIAHNVKKEFDKAYGPVWHCIVGSSFGSFVTHATGCFLYFSMENLHILLFKTKVKKVLD